MRARSFAGFVSILTALMVVISCSEQNPTSPADFHPVFAKSGGAGPTVKSTNPSRGEPGVTLDVHVFGSGYNAGSSVKFGIAGIPSPKIATNRTMFVSSTELVANITIAADADLDSYDVIVITSEGKKGIGTEMFLVAYAVTDLGTASFTTSEARDVNQDGLIVGLLGNSVSPNVSHAVMWRYISPTQIETVDLHGLLQPALRSIAYSVNATGSIVGFRQIDSNTSTSRPFIVSSAGVATTLHGACGPTETSRQSHAYDISDNGDIIGTEINGGSWAIYWAPNAVCAEVLPVPAGTLASEATHISPNGNFISGSINDASNVLYPARWARRVDGTGWDFAILGGVQRANTSSIQDDGAATGFQQVSTLVRQRGSSYYDLSMNGYVWTSSGSISQVPSMGGDQVFPSQYGVLGLVGWASLVIDGPSHAFVDDGTGLADLGVLVVGGNSLASATAGSFIVGRGDVNTPGRGIESHAMVWVAR